jgi:hypothetical protein
MTKVSLDSSHEREINQDTLIDGSSQQLAASFPVQHIRSVHRKAAIFCFVLLFGMLTATQFSTAVRYLYSKSSRNASISQALTDYREPLALYIDPLNRTVYPNTHVRQLLDFAIIGNAKCGTTFLQTWLGRHPEISMYNHELHFLKNSDAVGMTEALYDLDASKTRGYKSPGDVGSRIALRQIHTYWPDTKLIVGVRHPVTHFESWYNYKTRKGMQLGHYESVAKLPFEFMFHSRLSLLGKTNVRDPVEAELLNHLPSKQPQRMSNPVFLYEVSQIFDPTDGRNTQFSMDFQNYLGLTEPFRTEREPSPSLWRRFRKFVFNQQKETHARESPNYHYAIDICQDEFIELRAKLMENGGKAATWIRDYFMNSTDVFVSSPEHFLKLLDSWTTDPCLEQASDKDEATLTDAATEQ